MGSLEKIDEQMFETLKKKIKLYQDGKTGKYELYEIIKTALKVDIEKVGYDNAIIAIAKVIGF